MLELLHLKHLIYRAVEDNPEISKKKLSWAMSLILGEEESRIDACISEMMESRPELVRCLNHFKVPENRTRKGIPVVLLRVNPSTRALVDSIFVAHQKVNSYEVQRIKLGGVKDGSNAFEKVGAACSVPNSTGR